MSAEIRVLKTEYGDILQIRIPKIDGNVLKKRLDDFKDIEAKISIKNNEYGEEKCLNDEEKLMNIASLIGVCFAELTVVYGEISAGFINYTHVAEKMMSSGNEALNFLMEKMNDLAPKLQENNYNADRRVIHKEKNGLNLIHLHGLTGNLLATLAMFDLYIREIK